MVYNWMGYLDPRSYFQQPSPQSEVVENLNASGFYLMPRDGDAPKKQEDAPQSTNTQTLKNINPGLALNPDLEQKVHEVQSALSEFFLIPEETSDVQTSVRPLSDIGSKLIVQEDYSQASKVDRVAADKVRIEPKFVLDLTKRKDIFENAYLGVFKNHPDIQAINLSGLSISDEILRYIGENYPNLRVLNISHCYGFTQKGINDLAKGCKNIEKLDTSGLEIEDGGFNSLLAANENLVKWTARQTRYCTPKWGNKTLLQLSKNSHLKVFIAEYWSGSTLGVAHLAKGCPSLRKLVLNNWNFLDDDSLREVGVYARNLKHLDINGSSWRISAIGIKHILQLCKKSLTTFKFNKLPYVDADDPQLVALSSFLDKKSIQDEV